MGELQDKNGDTNSQEGNSEGKPKKRSLRKTILIVIAVILGVAVAAIVGVLASFQIATVQNQEFADSRPESLSESQIEENNALLEKAKQSPVTTDSSIIVPEEEWYEYYPYQSMTWDANAADDQNKSYLEEKPYEKILFEGIGFSKEYNSPRGHQYTLEDVESTERISETTKVTCFACKGPGYEIAAQNLGDDFYDMTFEDAKPLMEESVTCYDCHLNNPAFAGSSRSSFNTAFPNAAVEFGPDSASCGQCHNDHYFVDGEDVQLPFEMTDPTDMLNFYNENGIYDYVNPRTGCKEIKAEHPEITMAAGSIHEELGVSCVDCHMERTVSKTTGAILTSHTIVNPGDSTVIQETVCGRCHDDVSARFRSEIEITERIGAREDEIGENLADLINLLADAVASGKYTDEQLDPIRQMESDGQFYWDYEDAENSQGFHNQEMADKCLDLAEENYTNAMAALEELTAE